MGLLELLIAATALVPAQDERARALVEQLRSDRIEERDEAMGQLEALGHAAERDLEKAAESEDLDLSERAKRLLRLLPFREKRLSSIPEGAHAVGFAFSRNGRTVAYRTWIDGDDVVFTNDKRSELFDDADDPVVSPDGRVVAYFARRKDRAFVVAANRKGEDFDSVGDFHMMARRRPVLSPDGKRVAYQAMKGGEAYIVVDGLKSGPYFDVDDPTFSPNSVVVGYAANLGGTRKTGRVEGGKWFIVVGDRKGPEFDAVPLLSDMIATQSPVFSPDGSRVAYAAKKGRLWHPVVDGKVGEGCELIWPVFFSSDGKRVVHVEKHGDKWWLVVDGVKRAELAQPVWGHALSPDGGVIVHVARSGSKFRLVVGDKPGPLFDKIFNPVLSSDGTRVAYVVKRDGNRAVAVDDRVGEAFDRVSSPAFAPDGSRVAYSASQEGKVLVVFGDRKGEPFDDIPLTNLSEPPVVFAPDGSSVAYRAKNGDRHFVVAGTNRSEPFDQVWEPVYSPDGKKVAFGARKGRELWWKVLEVR